MEFLRGVSISVEMTYQHNLTLLSYLYPLKMDIKEEKLCRLCLNDAETEFEIIDEMTRCMLDHLLLIMDLDVTENPIMCHNCSETVKRFYNFKSIGGRTEEAFIKKETSFEWVNVGEYGTGIDENSNTCRFCMNPQAGLVVPMGVLVNEPEFEKMVPIIRPDMEVSTNTLICTLCRDNMLRYVQFVQNCRDTEGKINTYCQREGTSCNGKVNLNNVQRLFNEGISEYSDKRKIKQETVNQQSCNDFLKYEELYIKDEAFGVDETCRQSLKNTDVDICDDTWNINDTIKETDDTQLKLNFDFHTPTDKDAAKEMYKCTMCIYKTNRRNNLTSHMLIHKDASEVEMYKCVMCVYETKRKRNLKCHMKIHKDTSKVETYKCALCMYETKWKCTLNNHMLTHKDRSEVNMHKCALCTFESKYRRGLKEHMLVHRDLSKMKTYKCRSCIYQTKKAKNLKSHMLVHKDTAEVEMYKCGVCVYETKRKRNLNKHVLTHKDKATTIQRVAKLVSSDYSE